MSRSQGIHFFKAPRLIEFQCSRFHKSDFKHSQMKFITFYTMHQILDEYGSCVINGHIRWVDRKTEKGITVGDILDAIDQYPVSELFIDLYVADPYEGNSILKSNRVYTYLLRRVPGHLHRKKPVYDLECVSDIKTFHSLKQLRDVVKKTQSP